MEAIPQILCSISTGIQTSIMDAFVTFFVLSTTKLLCVSYDLLIGIRVFTPEKYLGLYLYYDPSIKLYGADHLLFVLTAITILVVFIIFQFFYYSSINAKCFKNAL